MRILMMSPHLNVKGGATRVVVSLAKHLSKKGDYVEVWSHQVDLKKTFGGIEDLRIRNIAGCSLPNPVFSQNAAKIRDAYFFLSNAVSATAYLFPPSEIKNFDVINCHNFPSYLVALSSRVKGKPIVWHCNEPPLELYPAPQQGAKYETMRFLHVMRPFEKTAVSKISCITVHGQMIKQRVKRIYQKNPLVIGPLGVDIKKFRPVSSKIVRDKYDIGGAPCIMTLAAFYKRLDILLRICIKVKERFGDVKLLLAGASHGRISEIHDMIKRFKLSQSVILAPDLNDDDLPYYYSASDVFVFPQPHWGFSLVVMEAMACGKPVVVPGTCAAAEIIDGNNGVVTDITNSTQTANIIAEILGNEEKREMMGKVARQYAERFLDTKIFLQKYYKVMHSLK